MSAPRPEQANPPRKHVRAPRPKPFSLRLSAEERTRLEQAAGGQPIGGFIKARLFGEGPFSGQSLKPARRRVPVKDHQALGEVLAKLGASRIAGNLNQLAHAASLGALHVDEAVRQMLEAACREIVEMRLLLMRGLGISGRARQEPSPPPPSLQEPFRQASRSTGERR